MSTAGNDRRRNCDAEEAWRVITYFDSIIERGESIHSLLNQTARFVARTVGIRSPDDAVAMTVHPDGSESDLPAGPTDVVRTLSSGGHVWISPGYETSDFDCLVVDRLALAVTVTLRMLRTGDRDRSESALVQTALCATTGEIERARALRLLGFRSGEPLRAAAIAGLDDGEERVVDQLRSCDPTVRVARAENLHMVVTAGTIPDDLSVPIGTRMSVGRSVPAREVWRSWHEAHINLSFSLPSTHDAPPYSYGEAAIVRAERVGCFSLLAQYLPAEALADVPDVRALNKLVSGPGGTEMLRTLEAVAATESLRRAATLMHMHHNSVAHRIARAEHILGFEITVPYGRVRLMMILVMRRLLVRSLETHGAYPLPRTN